MYSSSDRGTMALFCRSRYRKRFDRVWVSFTDLTAFSNMAVLDMVFKVLNKKWGFIWDCNALISAAVLQNGLP